MTIEGLEIVASNLYRDAEEDSPILGNTGKKEWMANRLEDIIDNEDEMLKDLLTCDTVDDVLARLEAEYDEDHDRDLADKLEEDEDEETVIANPVMREDVIINPENREELRAERDVIIDEKLRNRQNKLTDKERRLYNENDDLQDNYISERPEQPEYLSDEPEFVAENQEFFDGEPPVIEDDEILIIRNADPKKDKICVGELNEDRTCKG